MVFRLELVRNVLLSVNLDPQLESVHQQDPWVTRLRNAALKGTEPNQTHLAGLVFIL